MLHFSPKKYKTIVSKTNRPEGNFVAHFSEKKKEGGMFLVYKELQFNVKKTNNPGERF